MVEIIISFFANVHYLNVKVPNYVSIYLLTFSLPITMHIIYICIVTSVKSVTKISCKCKRKFLRLSFYVFLVLNMMCFRSITHSGLRFIEDEIFGSLPTLVNM